MLVSSGVPQWNSAFIAEDFIVDCWSIKTIEKDQLIPISNYSDRFEILLSRGHGWINMSGLGLLKNDLIVGIEEPPKHSPSFEYGTPNTSVNISGPQRCVADKNYKLETFIRIKNERETT